MKSFSKDFFPCSGWITAFKTMEDNKALGVLGIIVSLAWCANCLIAVYLIMQVSLHCLMITTLLRNTNHTDLLDGKSLSIVFDSNVKQRRGRTETF